MARRSDWEIDRDAVCEYIDRKLEVWGDDPFQQAHLLLSIILHCYMRMEPIPFLERLRAMQVMGVMQDREVRKREA